MAKIVLPPVLVIKRSDFEKLFKLLMKKVISDNKIDASDLIEINRELKNWLITGMQTVDFENSYDNNYVLDQLVDELWADFYRDLNMKVKKYRTKFKRKSL